MAATVPEILDALDKAYDSYADARLAHGEAKANYERVRLGAVARSTEKSAAAKNAEADVLASEQKQALIRAEAMSEITQTHVRVLLGELVAAQTIAKYAGSIDGGGAKGDSWGDW
jgi:hypothetical protein